MQNDVIPKVIQSVNSASGLDRIDKNIKGVDSVQASNNPVLACAKKGDVYDKNAKDEGKCCKSLSFRSYTVSQSLDLLHRHSVASLLKPLQLRLII